MNIIKNTKIPFYFLHLLFIFSTVFLPLFNINFLFLQSITIITWNFNNNQCLLTQIENYLYNETLIQYYYTSILKKKIYINNIFLVPYTHRSIIYTLFYINLYRLILKNNN